MDAGREDQVAYLRVDHACVEAHKVPQIRRTRKVRVVDLAVDWAEPQGCHCGWNDADEAVPVHLTDAEDRKGAQGRTLGKNLVNEGDWPCAGVVREVVLFNAACGSDPELVNEICRGGRG